MIQIYHNPRCSKSRTTLKLLNDRGIEPEIILYLEQPPEAVILKDLTRKLDCSIHDIVRKREDIYKQLDLANKDLDEQQMIDVVAAHPKLLERPIVVNGNQAAIGRPPENVLEILS